MAGKTALPPREEFYKLFGASAPPVLDGLESVSPLVVDYDSYLGAMIRAGCYDLIDPRIRPENFPINRRGKEHVVARPVLFDGLISSGDAILRLLWMGLKPATLPELLAYGAKFPDEQRKHAVIALGTIFADSLVPYLGGGPKNRDLGLEYYGGGWLGAACRFLGTSVQ